MKVNNGDWMLLFSTITMHAGGSEKEFWNGRNKASKKEEKQKLEKNRGKIKTIHENTLT
jgi:hypothetical protein